METPDPSTPFPAGTPGHEECLTLLEQAINRHRDRPLAATVAERGLGPYRGYAEMLMAIERLAKSGARLVQTGFSVRGEPLIALSFGPVQRERASQSPRTSVVVSGLHPIEWIGIETALNIGERLAKRKLDRSVLVLPIANPDGVIKVEKNLRNGKRRFVRHNARGVDLNRNFDAHWSRKNALARLVPWVYKPGMHAASEPEVSAIAFALASRRVDRALSLHSFGGVVLYPTAHSLMRPADSAEHRRWARRIGRQADVRAYRALPASWFGLGMTMGGLELDWFHERHGALSLLIECSRGGVGLSLKKLFEPFAWFNPPDVHDTATRIAAAAEPFVAGEVY
jgi:hypothetical protein